MQMPLFSAVAPSDGLLAGVDEAGRGPLAGPVFAAAVILDDTHPIAGIQDSKTLSAAQRTDLARMIRDHALAWHIASASVAEIDRLNILGATMLAMRRACLGLQPVPQRIVVDGNRVPEHLPCPAQAIIKGDSQVAAIAAASILAKTARDADCLHLHQQYAHYGFDQHKGYATRLHLSRLQEYGPCPAHRRSFAPVQRAVQAARMDATATPSSGRREHPCT